MDEMMVFLSCKMFSFTDAGRLSFLMLLRCI